MNNIIKTRWPIIFIVIIGIGLRLISLESLFYFTYDEEIPAFVGKSLYDSLKFPLIGGVTPFGVHLPPYFYWLLATLISINNLNPLIWGVASAILSSVTIILIYIVGKDFFNKKTGYFAAIIWSFSYIANVYDRHLWALYWGPMLALATLYSLKRIQSGYKKSTLLLAAVFVWSVSTDPSNLIFIFLSIAVFIIYKIKITKTEILAIVIVTLSLFPLVFFDLRHNFTNTKPLLQYLQADKSASRFVNQNFMDRTFIFSNSFVRLIYPFGDQEISKQYSYCKSYIEEKYSEIPYILKIIALFALTGFTIFGFKSKNKGRFLMSSVVIFYFIGIQAYGSIVNGDIFEHYLTGLFPIFVLFIAYALSRFSNKAALIVLTLFMILNMGKLFTMVNSHGLTNKKAAIEYVGNQSGTEEFSLESLSTCWRYSGYRYLFAVYGQEPIKSYVDPNLGHLYGTTPISATHPGKVVVFVTHDFLPETKDFYKTYALYKSHEIESAIFGNIEVIIMDNTTRWF